MLNITIEIKANGPGELETALAMLADTLGPQRIVGASVSEDMTTAEVVAAPGDVQPAAGRRTRKKAEPDVKAEDLPPANEPGPEPEKEAASLATVQTLSPADARAEGIKILQQVLAQNPNNMPTISTLQKKFGVRMFSEIPDDKAHEFLADAKLAQSGNVIAG